jgi:hypothetical protein
MPQSHFKESLRETFGLGVAVPMLVVEPMMGRNLDQGDTVRW